MSTADMAGVHSQGEPARAVGVVPVTGRGSLPFALLHGEPLVAVATWALEAAGVGVLDFDEEWAQVRARAAALVVHDPLCPLTPESFLRSAVRAAAPADAQEHVVVGVRPVTDTIKTTASTATGLVVGDTVDRDSLWTVTSPVVLPPAVVAGLDEWPDLDDVVALVSGLRERLPTTFLEAPALGRRVEDESALAVLEAFAGEHPDA